MIYEFIHYEFLIHCSSIPNCFWSFSHYVYIYSIIYLKFMHIYTIHSRITIIYCTNRFLIVYTLSFSVYNTHNYIYTLNYLSIHYSITVIYTWCTMNLYEKLNNFYGFSRTKHNDQTVYHHDDITLCSACLVFW